MKQIFYAVDDDHDYVKVEAYADSILLSTGNTYDKTDMRHVVELSFAETVQLLNSLKDLVHGTNFGGHAA